MRYKERGIEIQHEGIVQKTDANEVSVRISANTACSGCQAEGFCSLSEKKEKIISVPGSYKVSPGDHVIVQMKKEMGYTALVLGYIIPLAAVIAALVILSVFSVPEIISGVLSVGILLPYYLILFLMRKRIDKKFVFTLKI
jgi:sigma-E factor negative regulatory protein RseC